MANPRFIVLKPANTTVVASATPTITARKVIQILDKPNKNGRIYPTAVVQEALGRLIESTRLGRIGMPDPEHAFTINLDRVSHRFTNLRIEGDELVGDLEILHTAQGEMLKELEYQNAVAYRLVGAVEVNNNKCVTLLRIVAINAVSLDTAA